MNNLLGMLRTEWQLYGSTDCNITDYKQMFMQLYSMNKKQLDNADLPSEVSRYLRLYASNAKKDNYVVKSRNWRKLLCTVADYGRAMYNHSFTHNNIVLFDNRGNLWIVPTAKNDVVVAYHGIGKYADKYLISQRWINHQKQFVTELRSQHYHQTLYSDCVSWDFQYNNVVYDHEYRDVFHRDGIDTKSRLQSLVRSFVVMNGDYIV
jgi:hypothetical protein